MFSVCGLGLSARVFVTLSFGVILFYHILEKIAIGFWKFFPISNICDNNRAKFISEQKFTFDFQNFFV